MSVDNCIFCKILADEIPSSVVYEDDMFRAILDGCERSCYYFAEEACGKHI